MSPHQRSNKRRAPSNGASDCDLIDSTQSPASVRQTTPAASLTKKEQEVLLLVGSKLDCKRIAATMHISVFTVRKHRGNILRKLNLQTTAQLTAFALATIRTVAPMRHDLTPREAEIVRFVTHGLTSKEIARRLRISPLTVRKHRENAMRNLGVHTMADLMDAARFVSSTDTLLEA